MKSFIISSGVSLCLLGSAMAQGGGPGGGGGGGPGGGGGRGGGGPLAGGRPRGGSMQHSFLPGMTNPDTETDTSDPLEKPPHVSVETLPHLCGCVPEITDTSDIREISDEYCAGGNEATNSYGLSNFMWAFGQLLDHEIVALTEDESSPTYTIDIDQERTMTLHKVATSGDNPTCPEPLNVHTGVIDGSVVYGTNAEHQLTLRDNGSCYLRTAQNAYLPLTTEADEDGAFFIVAGDGRVDENAVLTTMHTMFMREHNRQCDIINAIGDFETTDEETKFQMAKAVVAAKLQQIILTGFLPAFGITQQELEAYSSATDTTSRISAEFSMAYRVGHTMVPNFLGEQPLVNLFNSQAFFLDKDSSGARYKQDSSFKMRNLLFLLAMQPASELDGKLSDVLRDVLFGLEFQEDLCSRNIFRSREMQLPPYQQIAQCFGVAADPNVETQDMFMGLLYESKPPGQPLGPTHKAIFVDQFSRSIFGPAGLYWRTDPTMSARVAYAVDEIESCTLSKVITDNFGLFLQQDVFKHM